MILPLDSDLFPVVDRRHWNETQNNKAFQEAERIRCSQEPWYAMVNYFYTIRKDETTGSCGKIERFPPEEYLRYICHKLFATPKIVIDKSRQLLINWVVSSYLLWHCMYREYEECLCQAQKEVKADAEIIKRAYGIWERLPGWLKPHADYSFCSLKIKSMHSEIIGVPAGEDQVRSHNPTRYFGDECAFWEAGFEDCRTAALACCENIILVSTAQAGEFCDFVHDRLVA